MIFLLYLKCIACKCAAASICRLESCVKDFLGLFEMAIDSHFLLHWFQCMFVFVFQLELSSQFEEMDRTESISPSGLFLYFIWDTLWIFSYLSFLKFPFLFPSVFLWHLLLAKWKSVSFLCFTQYRHGSMCVCVYTVFTLYLKSTTPSLCTHKLRWFPL